MNLFIFVLVQKKKETLINACKLVDNLIDKIYDDYKEYCIKKGINIPVKIAHKIFGHNDVNNKKNINLYY